MSTYDLAALDRPRPLDPDQWAWETNLPILRVRQPAIAERLSRVESSWTVGEALDREPTLFRERADGEIEWLDHTRVPARRAAGVLANVQPSDRNMLLSGLGTGCEIDGLLRRLASHQALFVCFDDPTALRGVLNARTFTVDLACGRLHFVDRASVEAELDAILALHAGLLPPTSMLPLPTTPPERIQELSTIMQAISERVVARRAAAASPFAAERAPLRDSGTPAIGVIALRHDPTDHDLARALAEEARALGWPAAAAVLQGPLDCDPLAHRLTLAEARPTILLGINHAPPPYATGRRAIWHVDPSVNTAVSGDQGTLNLAAAAALQDRLVSGGAASELIRLLPLGAPMALLNRAALPLDPRVVAVLGDYLPLDAEALGIRQPTHKQIWEALSQIVVREVNGPRIFDSRTLLAQAEQAASLRVDDNAIRSRLLELANAVLIPGWVLRTIVQQLLGDSLRISALGKGWETCDFLPRVPNCAPSTSISQIGATPRVAVAVAPTPTLSVTSLWAAAAGWPLLIWGRAADVRRSTEPVLSEPHHLRSFETPRGLAPLLAESDASLTARATAAREHLRRKHTLTHRLRELAELMR